MLKLSTSIKSPAFAPLILAHYLNLKKSANIIISVNAAAEVHLTDNSVEVSGSSKILRYLAKNYAADIYTSDPLKASQMDYWIDFSIDRLGATDFTTLSDAFYALDTHLKLRSYLVGYRVKLADIAVWGALKANPIFGKHLKSNNKLIGQYLTRWYNHIGSLDFVQAALEYLEKAKTEVNKTKKDQGSFEIGLKDAVKGKVVTRFPPEPSGYLHIGHAKAALLNDYFAREYEGKLIVRFDDTNPSKEKSEFEESIKEDLLLIGIKGDVISHTSDYFDVLYKYAIELIKRGKAYVDDTDQETMRAERMDGIESKNRNRSVEENLKDFEEMTKATERGLKCCVRAKMDMKSKNKAMRDTVIYRCNLQPHIKTGDKWKVYPTYDFACPIVDSIEGVTHALRTNEYRDRNEQYEWFLKALELRHVHIWDYRKLTWFVEQGLVSGWDDPRFPTVRGIRRRGMTIEALRQYILMQGASQKELMLEWDKIWSVNKKVIDPVAPRYAVLKSENLVKVTLTDDIKPHTKEQLLHKKNPEVGVKQTAYTKEIYMEQDDLKEMVVDEEITLMDWGNAFVKSIQKNADGTVESAHLTLHLEGDFKKTKKKVTWLANNNSVPVRLLDYDYLITKKKLEEEDDVKDFITKQTEFITDAVADANIKSLKKGDIIQFERKGYHICDKNEDSGRDFIFIPDGKAGSMQSKAEQDTTPTEAPKKEEKPKKQKTAKKSEASKITMYKAPTFYGKLPVIDCTKFSKMYAAPVLLAHKN